MNVSGIYKIVNKINGHFYLGSSENIYKRWKRHLYDLNRGRHHNIILQRAWIKYGAESFSWVIFEKTSRLLAREQELLDSLKPIYNIGKQSSGGDNVSIHPNLLAIRQKHSKNLRRSWENPVFRANQLKRLNGSTNPNWRGGVSRPNCLDCGKEISSSRVRCVVCSKSGSLNPFFGKNHSEETKQRLRDSNRGRQNTAQSKSISINGVLYRTYSEAAIALKVSGGTITNWATGRIKKTGIIIQLHPL